MVGLLICCGATRAQAQPTADIARALDIRVDAISALSFGASDERGFGIFANGTIGFPRQGADYVVLSTGTASEIFDTGGTLAGGGGGRVLGGLNTAPGNDLVQMDIELIVPAGRSSVSFDWKFYSAEFPTFVGGNFNDAFLAERDASTFTIQGNVITAENNVAFDQNGDLITINTTGELGMSAAEAGETAFSGATPTLTTTYAFPPSLERLRLIFSVMDVGDDSYDSAVFLDNFRFGNETGGGTGVASGLTVTASGTPQLATDFALSVSPIGGDLPGATGAVFFRQTGETGYRSAPLSAAVEGFTAVVPAQEVTIRGLDYYVELASGTTTLTFPASNPQQNPARLQVAVDQFRPNVALRPVRLQMVSVPLLLDAPGPAAVLEDDYGPFDPEQWQLHRWRGDLEAYETFPGVGASFVPGTAFWLVTRTARFFEVEEGLTVPAAQPFVLTLQPGWNQIGNPFAFPIAWEAVSFSGDIEPPVGYSGTDYVYDQPVLMPWLGYFVFNAEAGPVVISIPPLESGAVEKGKPEEPLVARAEYALQLIAAMPEASLIDAQNVVGFMAGASRQRDVMDVAEAPPVGEAVQLSILHGAERLAGSYVPTGIAGHTWNVSVSATTQEVFRTRKRVTITPRRHGDWPDDMHLRVMDATTGRLLSEGQPFTLVLDRERAVDDLLVLIGTGAYLDAKSPEEAVLDLVLEVNYPNPFREATRITYGLPGPSPVRLEVFDVLGRRVRTLVATDQRTGFHHATWDGRDDRGRRVASGTYLYRLHTSRGTATRALLLQR